MKASILQVRRAADLYIATSTPVAASMVISICDQLEMANASIYALTLAIEAERGAANLYAKQVAHWIQKHDELLEKQLESKILPEVHYKRGYNMALSDAEEAIDDECRERVVTASDCIEIISNLGAAAEKGPV